LKWSLRLRCGLIHNGWVAYLPEVSPLAETQPSSFADSIRDARQGVAQEIRAQAEQIQKLNSDLEELRRLHERTEQEANRQWDEVARAAERVVAAASESQASANKALENVLGAIRTLMTCAIPEQVLEVLTQEASQWGVRAAIFDVRGKAAWGASAHGFGPSLSEKVLRSLIVPLNQDNPFRQVCETAGHVDASAETLKKNRNVLDKLKPAPQAPIVLLPIRSTGTVSAIFYADPGEKGDAIPVNPLKILAEFAGAQIDRLMALSGGFTAEGVEGEGVKPTAREAAVQEAEPSAEPPALTEPALAEPVVEKTGAEVHAEAGVVEPPVPAPEPPAPPAEVAAEPPAPVASGTESAPAALVVESAGEVVPPPAPVEPAPPVTAAESAPPPAPAAFDITKLSEAFQKVHKDARRFAKLLVSEIELYNKAEVANGRKNRDLYKRLKTDIDRSRQTYEKRFGKLLSKQFDYFYDELVKTLAANDSSALGPDCPGPTA
jgi:hypothetical protein